ncbi:MAG TPA: glycosyltransferase [Candidatus Methylomirabilis sp.]|nr:glycosyltransferase [Candidatus Methylomirabilis sp.]
MDIEELKNKKIIFATYSTKKDNVRMAEGPALHLLNFFVDKCSEFALLEQPYFLYADDLTPTIEIYKRGKLEKKYKFAKIFNFLFFTSKKRKKRGGTSLRSKIRDFLSIFYYFVREKRKYDLFIGMESINTLAGIFLKKIGMVNKVAYYLFDFTPERYKNKFLNFFYLWLDKFCCYHSDYIWNISAGYENARRDVLKYDLSKMAQQITLNYGVDNILLLPEEKLHSNQLIFTGSIGAENGVGLLVEMMSLVLKNIPDCRLIIMGAGPEEGELKKKIISMDLQSSINFLGFVPDRKQIEKIQSESCIALAPYPDLKDSTKKYGDVMKIREYFARGLPVVTTSIPPISKVIREMPAGLVAEYNKESFSEAIVKLLRDKELYRKCRANAHLLAQENTWQNNISEAINKMEF